MEKLVLVFERFGDIMEEKAEDPLKKAVNRARAIYDKANYNVEKLTKTLNMVESAIAVSTKASKRMQLHAITLQGGKSDCAAVNVQG